MKIRAKNVSRHANFIWRYLQIYFYYTAKPHLFNPIYWQRTRLQKKAFDQVSRHDGLKKILDSVGNQSSSTGCQYSDYTELYNEIKLRKPKNVLELGSGVSSSVIALALMENGQDGYPGFLTSMEESEFYHNEVVRLTDKTLQNYIQFIHSPRMTQYFGERLGCYYENIPLKDYDFVYIDGPTLRKDSTEEKAFNADIIKLFPNIDVDQIFFMIDQRIDTYWVLKSMFPETRIKYNVVKQISKAVYQNNDPILNSVNQ